MQRANQTSSKIIVKKFMSDEVLAELDINLSGMTIAQFGNLFFEKFNEKYVTFIEPTQYNKRDSLIIDDFNFYYQGKKFTCANDYVYGFNIRNQMLSTILSIDRNECIVYAGLSVYGKNNYCLNSHVKLSLRKDVEQFINAAKNGDVALVTELIKKGIDLKINGDRALHESAANGHIEIMELLLLNGVDVDATSKYGNPALTWAATCKQIDSMKFLLEHGANVEATNCSALILAVANNSYTSVAYLLENVKIEQTSLDCALCWAVEKNHVAITMKLVLHGANIHSYENKPIEMAIKYKHHEIEDFFKNLKNISDIKIEFLNGTQKNIIEAVINFPLEDILERLDKRLDLCIKALKNILSKKVSENDINFFNSKEINVWDSMEAIRNILSHPCPQNRTENYPYFGQPSDSNMVVYKDIDGKPVFEQKGLLGLTARNSKDTFPVTKEAVVNYIHEIISKAITMTLSEISKQEQNILDAKIHNRTLAFTEKTTNGLLDKIFQYLQVKDLSRASRVNTYFYNTIQNNPDLKRIYDKQNKIQLFFCSAVKRPDLKTITLNVRENDNFDDIKTSVAEKLNVNKDNLRLTLYGKRLSPDHKVSDHQITENETITYYGGM